MADDIFLGILKGKIAFDLPKEEMNKLQMGQYQSKLSKNPIYAAASSQGGSNDSSDQSDINKKKSKDFLGVLEKNPMGQSLKGIGKLLGPIALAISFIMASGGLRELLGAFFDIIGLFSDLIFVAIFPILKPILNAFIKMAQLFVSLSSQPGGILGAILNPQIWTLVALYFINGLLEAADAIIKLATAIVQGMVDVMKGKSNLLGDIGVELGNVLLNVVQVIIDLIKFDTAVTNFVDALVKNINETLSGKIPDFLKGFNMDDPRLKEFMSNLKNKFTDLAGAVKNDFLSKVELVSDLANLMKNVFMSNILVEAWMWIGRQIWEGIKEAIFGAPTNSVVIMPEIQQHNNPDGSTSSSQSLPTSGPSPSNQYSPGG